MIFLLFCFMLSMDGIAQETCSRIIDRATPVKTLEKISRERMDQIAQPLIDEGFLVQVSA